MVDTIPEDPVPKDHRIAIGDVVIGMREYGRSSSKPSLVFLPALGVPLRYYDKLLRLWAARGRHVLSMEWRGMPESPVGNSGRARFGYSNLLREDLPAVVRLAQDLGTGDVVMVGHSMGGQLAVLAAVFNDAGLGARSSVRFL